MMNDENNIPQQIVDEEMEYEIDLKIELHFPEIDASMEIEFEEEILLQENNNDNNLERCEICGDDPATYVSVNGCRFCESCSEFTLGLLYCPLCGKKIDGLIHL